MARSKVSKRDPRGIAAIQMARNILSGQDPETVESALCENGLSPEEVTKVLSIAGVGGVSCLIISSTRKLLDKKITGSSRKEAIKNFFDNKPVSCMQGGNYLFFFIGDKTLSGKKNRRASKILSQDVYGDVLVTSIEGEPSKYEFSKFEKNPGKAVNASFDEELVSILSESEQPLGETEGDTSYLDNLETE